MLVRLELLKMARESLPGAHIDDVIAAAEKMAAFVEEDGDLKTTDQDPAKAEVDRAVDFITSLPEPKADAPPDPPAETKPAPSKPKSGPKPATLTDKQRAFYDAMKGRLESGKRFVLKDVATDIGTSLENAYATATALDRKGFIKITRLGGNKPSTYAILKDAEGKKLPEPLASNPVEDVKRPVEAKPAPRPQPASKPTNTVVNPVNQHLVRAARPVSLNTPVPAKQEPPAYDESMVRRFEPKTTDKMIREALEGQGYEVQFSGSPNGSGTNYKIDGKPMKTEKVIELADEIRAAKKLEPIGNQQMVGGK